MINQLKTNRGGRPRNPDPPESIAEVRRLLAVESVKSKPRTRTLTALNRLHKAMLAGETLALQVNAQKAAERKIAALEELAAVRKAEYVRRFATTEHGARALLQQIENLKTRVAELENVSGTKPTPTGNEDYVTA